MKKEKEFICPYCKENLKEIGIYECQNVSRRYNIEWDENSECFEYSESEDLGCTGKSIFYCANCDKELSYSYNDIM